MKQDYFEESFKAMLEKGEEHPFDQDQWRRLDRRLREADRPITPIWLRWLPVAFLLLLGASIWQHLLLSHQIDTLKASLLTNTQLEEKGQIKTTVVYDTVYLRTTVQKSAKQAGNQLGEGLPLTAFPERLSRSDAFTFPVSFAPTGNLDRSFREFRQRLYAAAADKSSIEASNFPLRAAEILPEEPLGFLKVNAPFFPPFSAPASAPYSPPKPSLFQRVKPKYYAFDFGVGGMRETNFLKSDDDWMAGIGLQLGFGKRIRLRFGADYLSRYFRIDEDRIVNFDLPIADPRDEDDELKNISGAPSLLQLPIGLQIKLLTFGKFSTFAEGGAVATLALPNTLRYNFEAENNDEDYDIIVDDMRLRSLQLNAWYGRLGLQYDLHRRWDLQLTATRQQSFGDFTYAYEPLDFLHYRLSGVWKW